MSDLQRSRELIDRSLAEDGRLEASEWDELYAVLESDPESWRLYRRTLDTEALLRGLAEDPGLEERVMEAIEEEPLPASAKRRRSPFACPRVFAAAAAALVAAIPLLLLWRPATTTAPAPEVAAQPAPRAGQALALYTFDAGAEAKIEDRSSSGLLDLSPLPADSELEWASDGLHFDGSFFLSSDTPATELVEACKRSGQISFETWITPAAEAQAGPARIVTLTRGSIPRAIMLAQGQYQVDTATGFVARVPTDAPGGTSKRPLSVPRSPAERTHLVFTCQADGERVLYINGERAAADHIRGGFGNWMTGLPISVGGDLDGNNRGGLPRTWRGVMHFLAIYPQALSAAEVLQNFNAGTDHQP